MAQISIKSTRYGAFILTNLSDERQTVLIQADWDYPSVARTFGWDMSDVKREDEDGNTGDCDHSNTDGTVDCSCGVTAAQFISAAAEYLSDNDGAVADDPGYFTE